MSGHSKWSKIKRQKGVVDAKRGQLFTKLAREISVAVRQGGADTEANFKLRLIMQKARDNNMPLENIDRAIKRASGGTDGAALSEVTYEGYGPGGSAILAQALTDNKNRTLSEVRNILSRGGGNLGESGSVTWLFESRGVIIIDGTKENAEEVALFAIDAGAEDVKIEGTSLEVNTKPQDLEAVRKALELKRFRSPPQICLWSPRRWSNSMRSLRFRRLGFSTSWRSLMRCSMYTLMLIFLTM